MINEFWGKTEICGKKMKFKGKLDLRLKKITLGKNRINFGKMKNNVHRVLIKFMYFIILEV